VVIGDAGVTDPAPFSVIVTFEADPPKLLPVMVIGAVPQVLPAVLPRTRVGAFIQPHVTVNNGPGVMQPAEFLTEI